jgi:glycosyltransferase involved in cell wall biosynthesis
MTSQVVLNGSYLNLRMTGVGTYILNLWHCWKAEGRPMRGFLPPEFSSDFSMKLRGHLPRLAWNQIVLPTLLRPGELLFNPVPEGPILSANPQVTFAHDVIPLIYPEWFPRKQNYFKYLVPACLKRSRHILCNSWTTKQDLMRFYDLPPEQLSVVPLAYDRERFFPGHADPSGLEKYGLQDQNYIFYVGAHEPHKNLKRLIEAFAQIAPSWEGHLVIAGAFDPRYTPALQALAVSLQIAERVQWLDYVSAADLSELYRGARLFAFVSLYEGFGLPVLEAMACGTPTLTSNRGALQEVACEGAMCVDPESIEAISAGIDQLLGDTTDFCKAGLNRAAMFSWERTAELTWQALVPFMG